MRQSTSPVQGPGEHGWGPAGVLTLPGTEGAAGMRRPRLGPVDWRLEGSPSEPAAQTPAVALEDGRWAALGPSAVRA